MPKAIYPGSFDPLHNGHVDVATRASKLFEDVVIGIYDMSPTATMFNGQERVDHFTKSVDALGNVRVEVFKGLAVDFARSVGAQFIVRGLRAGFDFEVEFEMALMWRSLAPDIDVICVMSALEYQFIHASRIKEVARLGGNVNDLVPPQVAAALNEKTGRPV